MYEFQRADAENFCVLRVGRRRDESDREGNGNGKKQTVHEGEESSHGGSRVMARSRHPTPVRARVYRRGGVCEHRANPSPALRGGGWPRVARPGGGPAASSDREVSPPPGCRGGLR